jgi:hypothetical protein
MSAVKRSLFAEHSLYLSESHLQAQSVDRLFRAISTDSVDVELEIRNRRRRLSIETLLKIKTVLTYVKNVLRSGKSSHPHFLSLSLSLSLSSLHPFSKSCPASERTADNYLMQLVGSARAGDRPPVALCRNICVSVF